MLRQWAAMFSLHIVQSPQNLVEGCTNRACTKSSLCQAVLALLIIAENLHPARTKTTDFCLQTLVIYAQPHCNKGRNDLSLFGIHPDVNLLRLILWLIYNTELSQGRDSKK